MPIRVICGDTFARACRYLNGKTRAPIDLTGSTITVQVRSVNFEFNVVLDCQILDQTISENKGRYLILPVDTTNWPIGNLSLKVTREQAGAKSSIKAGIVVEVG